MYICYHIKYIYTYDLIYSNFDSVSRLFSQCSKGDEVGCVSWK